MKILTEFPYDRDAAVAYARFWAYRRNPMFYDFEAIGGDCTNFASQCLLEGTGVMNFTPTYGWYYLDLDNRAPAWTGVVYFYDFVTGNKEVGPFGQEVEMDAVLPGDFCQLWMDKDRWQHTPIITKTEQPLSPDTIFIAAHSNDADCRPLSTYRYQKLRFVHIDGYRAIVAPPPPSFDNVQDKA